MRRHRVTLLHHHLVVRPLRDLGVGGVEVGLRRVGLLLLLRLLRLLSLWLLLWLLLLGLAEQAQSGGLLLGL